MMVQVKVSLGELVDKLSILEIKKEKITDQEKLAHVENEHHALTETLEDLGLDGIETFQRELKEVNLKLWDIEDQIREKERDKDFGQGFIDLARAVYITNDKRFEVKARCNQHFGSELHEVKSYEKYEEND